MSLCFSSLGFAEQESSTNVFRPFGACGDSQIGEWMSFIEFANFCQIHAYFMTYVSSSPFYPPLGTTTQAWPRGPVKHVPQSRFLEGCALVWRVRPLFQLADSSFFADCLRMTDVVLSVLDFPVGFFFPSLTIPAHVVFSYPSGCYEHEHHKILSAASGIWVLTAPVCEALFCFRLFVLSSLLFENFT